MGLKLKSYNVTLLQFSTTIALNEELISQIKEASRPDKDGDSSFVDSYDGHRAWTWVIEVDKGLKEGLRRFRIEFNYEVGRGGRLSRRVPRVGQLIEILSSYREKYNFDCRAAFEFGKRLKPKPIVVLPLKYLELPNMPFDRIQGVHLVKLDGGEIKYEVILEAPGTGSIIENVLFSYSSEVDETLPSKILTEAVTISDKFVLLER